MARRRPRGFFHFTSWRPSTTRFPHGGHPLPRAHVHTTRSLRIAAFLLSLTTLCRPLLPSFVSSTIADTTLSLTPFLTLSHFLSVSLRSSHSICMSFVLLLQPRFALVRSKAPVARADQTPHPFFSSLKPSVRYFRPDRFSLPLAFILPISSRLMFVSFSLSSLVFPGFVSRPFSRRRRLSLAINAGSFNSEDSDDEVAIGE